MKVLILFVISSLFFTTLIFAGEDDATPRFLDLKPATLPAEKQSGFTMPKEECKNGLYYNDSFDKCVISSNTTSIEKGKKEVAALKESKGLKQKQQVFYDAKKIGVSTPQPEQAQEQAPQ
jgi:hypothetical protein